MAYFTTKPIVLPFMFVNRSEFSKLEEIVFAGHQVSLISGYSGLGKTSMLNFLMNKHRLNYNFLYYMVEDGTKYDDLQKIVFKALKGEFKEVETINFKKAEGGVDIKFIKLGGEIGKAKIKKIIDLPPLDSIVSLLQETSKDTKKITILILDNIEQSSILFREKLLQMITKFHEGKNLNLIMSGWPNSFDELFMQIDDQMNKGILRRFSTVEMKPMPINDAQKIINKGFKKLKYSYESSIPLRIAKYAREDLGLIHEVGISISQNVKKDKNVTLEILKKAEIDVGKSNEMYFSRKFESILSQRGNSTKIGIREAILLILSSSEVNLTKNEIEKVLLKLNGRGINVGSSINQKELDHLIEKNHLDKKVNNCYEILNSRYSAFLKMKLLSSTKYDSFNLLIEEQ